MSIATDALAPCKVFIGGWGESEGECKAINSWIERLYFTPWMYLKWFKSSLMQTMLELWP